MKSLDKKKPKSTEGKKRKHPITWGFNMDTINGDDPNE